MQAEFAQFRQQFPIPIASPLYLYAQHQQQQQQQPFHGTWHAPASFLPPVTAEMMYSFRNDRSPLQALPPFAFPSSAASSSPPTPSSSIIEQGVEQTCTWIKSQSLAISPQSQSQIATKVVEHVVDTVALGLMNTAEEFVAMLGLTLPAGDFVKLRSKWNERPSK